MGNRLVTMIVLTMMASAFAFAANRSIQEEVKEKVRPGWLGVQIQDITSELRRSLDLQSRDGALVRDVVEDSPADSAGIKEDDVIVQFDGKDVDDASDLQKAVSKTKPGSKVTIVVLRKGEKKSIQVTIGKYPRKEHAVVVRPRLPGRMEIFSLGHSLQGLTLRELNDQLTQYFDVPDSKGVLVWEVKKETPADKAGFKAGDVITQVGKKRIDEIRDVSRALGAFDDGEKVDFEVVRKGVRKTLTMEVEGEDGSRSFNIWMDRPRRLPENFEYHFDAPEINLDFPHIEIERIRPHLDMLRIDIDRMKDRALEYKDQLQRELKLRVQPRVRLRVVGEV